MKRTVAAICVLLAADAIGCVTCPPCTAEGGPIRGSSTDFLAGPRETAAWSISAPSVCADVPAPAFAIAIQAQGSQPITVDWLERFLVARIQTSIDWSALFNEYSCGGVRQGLTVETFDWRNADQLARDLARQLETDDMSGPVWILVRGGRVACAAECS